MSLQVDRTRVFDKRVVQRYIRAGRVSKEEYAAWLTALADATENIKPEEEGGDADGFEPAPEVEEDLGADEDDDDLDDYGEPNAAAPAQDYAAPGEYGGLAAAPAVAPQVPGFAPAAPAAAPAAPVAAPVVPMAAPVAPAAPPVAPAVAAPVAAPSVVPTAPAAPAPAPPMAPAPAPAAAPEPPPFGAAPAPTPVASPAAPVVAPEPAPAPAQTPTPTTPGSDDPFGGPSGSQS